MINLSETSKRPLYRLIFVGVILVLVWVLPSLSQVGLISRLLFVIAAGSQPVASELGWRIIILCLIAGAAGLVAFSQDRRMAWLCFVITSALAYVQVRALDMSWALREEGIIVFTGQLLIWLLLPCIVQAYRYNYRTRILIPLSFQLAVLVNVLTYLVVYIFPALGSLIAPYSVPVIDATGDYVTARRFSGFMVSPNALGILMLLAWPSLLYPSEAYLKNSFGKYIRVILLVGAVFTIMATFSRAAYIGLLLQLAALSLTAVGAKQGSHRAIARLALTTFLIVGLTIALFFAPFTRRFFSALSLTPDASVVNRLSVYQIAIQLLLERPFCGWGPGTFAQLYNSIYAIPGTKYTFHDAHSAILCRLLEIGGVGVVFELAAIVGFSPLKSFRRIPIWIRLSLIGALVPLVAENPSRVTLAVDATMCWIAAAIVIYTQRAARKPKVSNRGRRLASELWSRELLISILLSFFWLGNMLVPPRSVSNRLLGALNSIASSLPGEVSAALYSSEIGPVWGFNGHHPYPSVLASLCLFAKTVGNDPHLVLDLPDFRPSPAIERNVPIALSAGDAVAYVMDKMDPVAAQRVVDVFKKERIDGLSEKMFGCPAFEAQPEGNFCPSCSVYEIARQRELVGKAMRALATSATVEKLAHVICELHETSEPCGRILQNVLRYRSDEWGMLRHLYGSHIAGALSFYSGREREEALIVSLPVGGTWVFAMRYQTEQPASARVDAAANKIFAMAGWRLWCVLRSHGPEILGELKQRQEDPSYRPRSQQFGWWLWEGLKRAWREN